MDVSMRRYVSVVFFGVDLDERICKYGDGNVHVDMDADVDMDVNVWM